MPELPEVECVRRTLEPHLVGARVVQVRLRRRDIVTTESDPAGGRARAGKRPLKRPRRVPRADLLEGSTIRSLERRGKQLAIIGAAGEDTRAMLVHLGMTGQLFYLANGARSARADHIHAVWALERDGVSAGSLVFRDPRRFGGLWTIGPPERLAARWSALGPDALTINEENLARRLAGTRRAIKAALLDQCVIAGVGNIYADEALFFSRIHPARPASRLTRPQVEALAAAIREVLAASIAAGGSTLRDYISGDGDPGSNQLRFRVYGRSGEPCTACRTLLRARILAQRTTTWCPRCQPRRA